MICAHPDDLPGCAGTAFLLRDRFELHVIDFTHGELGGGGAAGRTKEEERACALLGAHLHWLSNIDGSAFASKEACAELEAVLADIRPRAVITHWPRDRATSRCIFSEIMSANGSDFLDATH